MKKLKRCIAALLVCIILTTSVMQHTQNAYAIFGIDDVIVSGFATLVTVALAINGYSTGQMDSLHDLIFDVKESFFTIKDFLADYFSKNYEDNKPSLEELEAYIKDRKEDQRDFILSAFKWAFDSGNKMFDSALDGINAVSKFIFGIDGNNGVGVGKLTSSALITVWNVVKSQGLQQATKSDIFADYADDYGFIPYKWPKELSKTTAMSLGDFTSSFEPNYFYLCGYDSKNKKYFAIPLDPDQSYVYGKTSKGYYRLVTYKNPQALCSYFLEYGKGTMTYQEIMDSGINTFVSQARSWSIAGTSVGVDSRVGNGTGQPTTELIQFPYWGSSVIALSANFSDCYIMYPMASLDSSWVHKGIDLFYTHDGILARNECIKYSDVTELGASASALAGLKLGSEEFDIDSALLQAIYNRLNLDASITSDDIADMVADKNKTVVDSISSSSANVKAEIEKSNGFLSGISVTASKIKDIVTDIPGAIVGGISSALSLGGKVITGSIDLVGTVVTGIADVVTDIGGILADLLDIIFRAVVKALSTAFIPPDDFFNNWKDILEDMLENKLNVDVYLNFIKDIKTITSARLEDFKVNFFGKECTILTFSWYYKNQDTINDLIRGVTFLVLIFFNINQSYKMIRGTSLVKINMYAGRMGGDE